MGCGCDVECNNGQTDTGSSHISITDLRRHSREKYIRHFLHRVSKKLCKIIFVRTFVKFPPTVKMFGTKMEKRISLCVVHPISTSPNLCQLSR